MEKAQYAILRFAKYKGPEIGRIEAHDERTKEKYASNPDVDTSRSSLNFHLVKPHRSYRAEAEKQIAEAGCRARNAAEHGRTERSRRSRESPPGHRRRSQKQGLAADESGYSEHSRNRAAQ